MIIHKKPEPILDDIIATIRRERANGTKIEKIGLTPEEFKRLSEDIFELIHQRPQREVTIDGVRVVLEDVKNTDNVDEITGLYRSPFGVSYLMDKNGRVLSSTDEINWTDITGDE